MSTITAYVRPHMEYGVQARSLYMVKDIQVIEKVQLRRKRGHLIETYKILTGKEDIDRDQLFQLTPNIHSKKGHQ